jgi:hypothetical protein
MISLLIFGLWVLYATMEGMREAYYYSMKLKAVISTQKSSAFTKEHTMFTIQRAIALGIAAAGLISLGIAGALLVIGACCFPFFHDGAYYVTRHKLDGIYPDGWFSQSTTSTAVSDKLHLFGPVSRSIFLVLALTMLIIQSVKF